MNLKSVLCAPLQNGLLSSPPGTIKKGKEERKAWSAVSDTRLQQAWQSGVHFSFKYINTKPSGGVRLAGDDVLDLPYLSVRTVGPSQIETDYFDGIDVPMMQMGAIARGQQDEKYHDVPASLPWLQGVVAQPLPHAEFECDVVPMRLRQIISQQADGSDIALTPLVAGGLFKLLIARLRASTLVDALEGDDALAGDVNVIDEPMPTPVMAPEEIVRRRHVGRGFLNLGGSNPANAGMLIFPMRRPLWFDAPCENPEIRKAFALYHKGISLAVSITTLKKFRSFRTRLSHTGAAGQARCDVGGEPQRAYVRQLIAPVVARADDARATLQRMQSYLPQVQEEENSENRRQKNIVDSLPLTVALSVPRAMRAWLDPNARYVGWKNDMAYALYLALINRDYKEDHRVMTLGVAETDANGPWVDTIKGML